MQILVTDGTGIFIMLEKILFYFGFLPLIFMVAFIKKRTLLRVADGLANQLKFLALRGFGLYSESHVLCFVI